MLKAFKILAVSVYAVCGGLLLVSIIPQIGWKFLSVATSSMAPAIPQGSIVVIHHVSPQSLKVGDIVTYTNPNNPKETITHRIIQTKIQFGLPAFIFKGDANSVADPQTLGGNVVGKVEAHLPYLGKIVSFIRQPIGLIVLVIIPALLIIIDELRRLVKALSEPEAPADTLPLHPPALFEVEPEEPLKPKREAPVHQMESLRPRRRNIDGVRHLIILIVLATLVVHSTFALLNTKATLTGNTISTAIKANHLVISRVFLGGTGVVCPAFGNTSVTIINSGTGSNINVLNETNCNVTINNNISFNITNNSTNNSSSGGVSASGNTATGNLTTGGSSSSSSTSTTVTFGSPNEFLTQWFEIYNPTTAAVSLKNWQIRDNSGVKQTLPTVTVTSGSAVIIPANALAGGQIGNGLANAGDELTLFSPASLTVDGVSWGSDTADLNPTLPPIPTGGSAKRVNPNFDTDQASDWVVQGP